MQTKVLPKTNAATPVFLPGSAGNLFAIYHPAASAAATKRFCDILFVPPFAEEMNKSRRMFSLMARRCNTMGIGALILDLYATGDSEGEFAEARWDIWLEDLHTAVYWLRNHGSQHVCLLSLRLGALLAMDYTTHYPGLVARHFLWQPVVNGEQFLTQFLRLRLAANMMEKNQPQESAASLKQTLQQGGSLEVAGYELSSELYLAINQRQLADMVSSSSTPAIHWFDVAGSADKPLAPASEKVLQQLRQSGVETSIDKVVGEPFWSLQEITIAEGLLDATSTRINSVFAP